MTGSKIDSLKNTQRREVNIAAVIFLLPAMIFLFVYIVYPIIDSFSASVMQWNGIGKNRTFIGLANWVNLVTDMDFWKAFSNNLKIMFLSLLVQIPLSITLAAFLDLTDKKRVIYKIIWFLPYLLSSVIIGVLFRYALDANNGIIALISKLTGGGSSVDLLGNPKLALYTVIAVVCWQYTPFYMVLYLAAYKDIPAELIEAACMDGATKAQYFWRISLPMLRPAIISGMILSIIGSLKYFDLVFVMTGGGPGVATELMATYMYKYSFIRLNMGYGATVASGMFILITLIAFIVITLLNKKTEY
jgi:raffinose/stachyose/melibiose transport system permease protein